MRKVVQIMRRSPGGIAVVLALSILFGTCPARADSFATVFYLDKDHRPVTQLDRIAPMSDGLRAILAMYAFQAGGGCEGNDDTGLQCALTRSLGLGAQCSQKHVALVAAWFKAGLPEIGWSSAVQLARAQHENNLEQVCYGEPYTATFQSIWDRIRVWVDGSRIEVDATRETVRASDGTMELRRQTIDYEIDHGQVKVVTPTTSQAATSLP